ncbi:hypothetical protein GCK32_009238 [Trichostrongylus colubriformis]|uniref:Uncharacterized protein n=1 Tax=Trichostrongylus colubriformis TaxID=6319 RepID=A0AAN8G2C8_TRICO
MENQDEDEEGDEAQAETVAVPVALYPFTVEIRRLAHVWVSGIFRKRDVQGEYNFRVEKPYSVIFQLR